jgi:plastocyanin
MHFTKWFAFAAVAVSLIPEARSDARAKPVTHADIDRLEQKLKDQQRQFDSLIRLQTQYLQQLLAASSDGSGKPAGGDSRPNDNRIAAKLDTDTDTKAGEPRVAPSRPRPAALRPVGTIVGKVTGGGSDTFVYVEDVVATAQGTATMKQENKQFFPQVLAVQKGTRVDFPNVDTVFHNVFSVTPDNSFDLGSYQQGASKSMTMTKPGVITVYCNMHPQMVGYILVVPSKLYVRAGKDGFYRLPNVPVGRHRVVAWAPNAKPVVSEVEVTELESATTLELELKRGRPGPHTNKEGMAYGSYRD